MDFAQAQKILRSNCEKIDGKPNSSNKKKER